MKKIVGYSFAVLSLIIIEDRREKDPLCYGLEGFEYKFANFERLYLRAPMDSANVLGHL